MPTLHWLSREHDLKAAAQAPYRLLEHMETHGDPATENILIQGDNLDGLKALLPYYAGQVKCIFIDPPYNTKSAFEHYDDNLEHSQWLSLMMPRLELLRELLSEDGSIWVSIDDHECHYLKVLMDEVFGRGNFLANFIWKKSYGGGAKSRWFVGLHEHVICYAKNMTLLPDMWLPPDPEAVKKYYKYSDDKLLERGPYRLQPLATTSMDDRPNLRYPIPHSDGREIWPDKQWQWSRDRALLALSKQELVIAEKAGKFTVSYKQYLKDEYGAERKRKLTTIIDGHFTQHGTYESLELFGLGEKFSFPKPEGIVQIILEASTKPSDLVLDSFLGSGTTAAVAHKMGRRYIGVEIGEHAVTHCIPRLQKVIAGEQGGISKAVDWKGGGGFRFYRLGEPIFDADGNIAPNIRFPQLAAHVWFSETKTPWRGAGDSPLLGLHQETAYYLLYNGILGDRRASGGNVLTSKILAALPAHPGPKVIYGERTTLSPARLAQEQITFKFTPYDIKGR